MEERMLVRSSENISKLLTLMITHEYNVKNHMRNSRAFDIQLIFDRISLDISNNIQNQRDEGDRESEHGDISLNETPIETINETRHEITHTTFGRLESRNETICPITQEMFNSEDNVVLLQCGHYFKKDGFMVWARRSRSCPSCRANFR
jgi:hypothetical protein